MIFHKIDKVNLLYSSVLDIDLGDVKWLYKAVELRHHCVHRAGYDKDGNEVDINVSDIEALIALCNKLVHYIESEIVKIPEEDDFFSKTCGVRADEKLRYSISCVHNGLIVGFFRSNLSFKKSQKWT